MLSLNDQAQQEAGQRVSLVYGQVSKDILLLIGVLFLVALGTGLYTLQANRKTFERLHHLAEKLQSQSEQMRMLSWKLIEVQEQTLRHVARDLHDHFGQILTAIGVMLGRAGQKAADSRPGVCAGRARRQKNCGRYPAKRARRVADFSPRHSG